MAVLLTIHDALSWSSADEGTSRRCLAPRAARRVLGEDLSPGALVGDAHLTVDVDRGTP